MTQYLDDELELFDGVQQISKGFLSRGQSRQFYYNIKNVKKAIMVALKSLSDVKYRIGCKIIDWKKYLGGDSSASYPTFEDNDLFHT